MNYSNTAKPAKTSAFQAVAVIRSSLVSLIQIIVIILPSRLA